MYSYFGEVVIYNKHNDETFKDKKGDDIIFKSEREANEHLMILGYNIHFIKDNIVFVPVNYKINPSDN